jgi:hypothetical protein
VKKVSKTSQDQHKNKVVLITAIAFTSSYTIKAMQLVLAAWAHEAFDGTKRQIFNSWFGYNLYYMN